MYKNNRNYVIMIDNYITLDETDKLYIIFWN